MEILMKQYLCAFLTGFFLVYALPGFAQNETNEATKEVSYYGADGEVQTVKIICKERHYDNAKIRSCKNVNALQSIVNRNINADGTPGDYYAYINYDTGKVDEKGKPVYDYESCGVYAGVFKSKPELIKVLITFRGPNDPIGPSDVPRCCKLMTKDDDEKDTKNDC